MQESEVKCRNDGAMLVGYDNPQQFQEAANFMKAMSKHYRESHIRLSVVTHFLHRTRNEIFVRQLG